MLEFYTYCSMCEKNWESQKRTSLPGIMIFTQAQQNQNEAKMKQIIEDVQVSFQMDASIQDDAWQTRLSKKLKKMLKEEKALYLSWLSEEERESFLHITCSFIKDARSFDASMSLENIGQAMRNVWIFMLLEKLFDHPLRYHKAIFAYSMLYPYTDNFLDDTNITLAKKQAFNDWFTKRLQGKENLHVADDVRHIHRLIEMIEDVFPREQYQNVYTALLLIQQGQCKSLLQTQTSDQKTIMRISIEKGAASVIADGMLIKGELNAMQYQFCVEYGYMLQIADDIQDQKEDIAICHHTLASILTKKQERKALANQVLHYIQDVVWSRCPIQEEHVRSCIIQSCTQLLISSILKNAMLYPSAYIHQLKQYLPYQKPFIDNVKEQMLDMDEEQCMQYLDRYTADIK